MYESLALYLPPLRDRAGRPYERAQLPCVAAPHLWDEDAAPDDQRRARAACLGCPALEACSRRVADLGGIVEGTWAGRTYTIESDGDTLDAEVALWIVLSGARATNPVVVVIVDE